ncbi:hypothetical protein [Haploplasma modicum]|uniref:hypothetical protein n=1 Tax=Haploplasma modicum TaxID=2150 RepID=UPI000AE39DAC|nr:hypothetical protein [Haploplasma modicum]MCR1809481.1 hypothetical protein [Haploplasma modicum]
MKDTVKKAIVCLEKIKEERQMEQGALSELMEDPIIVTINNMIDVLKFEYLNKK